ncbi:cupin domain-containing protein [Streptosporangiaceae bacterium NEAU-GS5]|nr:cupin domain-containing protein [Streptosporangiaceae bacterium NEAU-GS5]
MSTVVPAHDVVVVREVDAEVIAPGGVIGRLYADSGATGGALSCQRITMSAGAGGATPHHHTTASELFYMIDGRAEFLAGDRIVTAERGDLVVVPALTAHAFAAAKDHDADILVIITPGVERFEYFRLLERLAKGEASLESVIEAQELYDNHFVDSEAWKQNMLKRL